jgi:hypothetical protein
MAWCLDQLTLDQLDVLPLPTAGEGPQPATQELDTLPLECVPPPVGEAYQVEHYSGDALGLGQGAN